MRKKKSIFRLVLVVLMAVFAAFAVANLGTIKDGLFRSAYAPSTLCAGENGTLYVVNSSKKSLLAFDRNAYVVGEHTIRSDSGETIETVCIDRQSGSVYIKTSTTLTGTLISAENIYRWDPSANEEYRVYGVSYGSAEAPYQYGNIKSLRTIDGQLYFASLEEGSRIVVTRLDGDLQAAQVTEYIARDHVSQITLLSEEGALAYSTREGGVYKASKAGTEELFESTQVDKADFISVPWMLSADDADRIYFTDIGRRLIVSLPDGTTIENPDGQILYTLAVDGSTVYATDYSNIYISKNGGPLLLDSRAYQHSAGTKAWHLFLFLCILAAAVMFLCLTVIAVRPLLQRVRKETTKRLLLCSLSSVAIASFISLLSGGNLLDNEKSTMLQTLESTGYSMQRYIDDNEPDFDSVNALSDYRSDPYLHLKQILDNLIDASYFADANGKNPMYYILYKNIGGTVCSVMDYEDSMCAVHPLDTFTGSDYERVYTSGRASDLIDYRGAYGNWQYILFPISPQTVDGQTAAAPGSATGFLEVGISTNGLTATLRALVVKLVLEIAFFTLLFLMILIEGFKAVATIGAYKRTGGRLSADESSELLGFIRLITLTVFMSDALQESFFAAAAGKLPVPFIKLSGELAGAVPISAQLFTVAVFSIFSGKLLRKISVKLVLRIGFAADAAGFLLCSVAIAGYYPLLLLGKVLIGAGMGICIASANVCASSVPEEGKKTSAFAELNAGILAGVTIGFAAGSHIATLAGYPAVYLTGAAILSVAAVLITKSVPDFQVRISHERITSLRFVLDRRVLGFLIFALLPFLVVINFREYFFVIYASQNGITEDRVGQLFLLCGILIIYLGPVISKKVTGLVGDRRMVFLATGVFMAALLLFALLPGLPAAVAGVVLVSLGISFGYTAQSNYYTELPVIRKTDNANSMGLYLMFDNLGQTIGPMAFGAVMTLGNQRSMLYIFIGLTAMAGIFALSSITKKESAYENSIH